MCICIYIEMMSSIMRNLHIRAEVKYYFLRDGRILIDRTANLLHFLNFLNLNMTPVMWCSQCETRDLGSVFDSNLMYSKFDPILMVVARHMGFVFHCVNWMKCILFLFLACDDFNSTMSWRVPCESEDWGSGFWFLARV